MRAGHWMLLGLLSSLAGCSFDYGAFRVEGDSSSGGAGTGGVGASTGTGANGAGASTGGGAGSGASASGGAGTGGAATGGAATGGMGGTGGMPGLPCDAPAFEDASTGHCYVVLGQKLVWDDARGACAAWRSGADLATITSAAENSLILTHVDPQLFDPNKHGTWIGLYDATQTDTWVWVSGDALSYESWDDTYNQPDDYFASQDEDCAGFVNLGAGVNWFDAPCDLPFESVCEWEP